MKYEKEKQNAQRGMYRLKDSLRKKENANIHYWYFSWAGFTEHAKDYAKKNNIHLVTGEELFECE